MLFNLTYKEIRILLKGLESLQIEERLQPPSDALNDLMNEIKKLEERLSRLQGGL